MTTLIDMFERRAAEARPDFLTLIRPGGRPLVASAERLWNGSLARAAGLLEQGLKPGDRFLLLLPNGLAFLETFMGAILAGIVPVIYPAPHTARRLDRYLAQLGRIVAQCRPEAILLEEGMLEHARGFDMGGVRFLPPPREADALAELARPAPEDLAVIQYSSGSTGDPKGAALSHRAILANAQAVGRAIDSTPEDVMVSWLPLCHDMGLFGGFIFPCVHGWRAVHLQPHQFLIDPAVWLETIFHFRATLTIAPNFAYSLCVHGIEEEQLEGLDLSSLRVAFNGAEPISRKAVEQFTRRFEPRGFRSSALFCVYGMAENTLAVAFPPVARGPRFDRVLRTALETQGRAEPAGGEAPEAEVKDVASVGRAIEGVELKIVDGAGELAQERVEGEIWIRGSSLMGGYWNHPHGSGLRDGWLPTGDFGYLAEGDLYVTGRSGDRIIRAGRNLHPQDIESIAGEVPGARRGCVVALGVRDAEDGTEEILVMAETRLKEPEALRALKGEVRDAVLGALGLAPDQIVFVEPRGLPKTSSGKLQRRLALRLFQAGELPVLEGTN